MKAILSSTYDDLYFFSLPFVVWSWNKIGVDCVIFMPRPDNNQDVAKIILSSKYIDPRKNITSQFKCHPDQVATYAQCSRLFGGCLGFSDSEILITGDADMAVFSKDLIQTDGSIHVWGNDLVPDGQFPVCYVSMPAATWRRVMKCGTSFQEMLDYHLGKIECENMRGNYWCKDQELLYDHIKPHQYISHPRAYPETQFATRREDRDSWGNVDRINLIDAHLKRPGSEENNFNTIWDLFQEMYPEENFYWMDQYRNQYLRLI